MATYRKHHERRQNHLYRTMNTDYHVRRNRCVGVRDRSTGQWYEDHMVLGSILHGSLEVRKGATIVADTGSLGNSLWFGGDKVADVITSPLMVHARPAKKDLTRYVSVRD